MDFEEDDGGEEGLDEKMRKDLKILEKQMAAKKDVLMEVLSTIENSEDALKSDRRRRNIRQILSAEMICEPSSSSSLSLKLNKVQRFGSFTCATIEVENLSKSFDFIPEVFTQPLSSSCRWAVFDDDVTVNISSQVISKSTSKFLHVAIPNSLFFDSERVSLAVSCKPVPENEQKLNPGFYSLVAKNQPFNLPETQLTGISIDNFLNIPVIDVNSIEYMDETAAQNTSRCIMTCYNRRKLKTPQDFSDFRRRFPKFTCCDYESWQILIGTQHFHSLFIIATSPSPSELPVIRNIYGRDRELLLKFAEKVENPKTEEE